jgi:putative phosphoesterase
MRIGVLSDTHGFLDEAELIHFERCDEIWHAGDFGSTEVLERLAAFKPLRGVFGNVDGPEVRARVPRDQVWSAENARIYMTHIGGYPGRYDPRALTEIARHAPDVFLCGHSHIVRIMRDPKHALLHINPGAIGHSGWHKQRTAVRFRIDDRTISDVELITLGPRGRQRSS